MDRFRQKSRKEKPMKYVDKEKSPMFITDVKTIKENLKIKEILRSVKMNSSMRIKAPRGSVVMNNNDFTDVHEDFLDENGVVQDILTSDNLQEAKNSDLVNNLIQDSEKYNTNIEDEIVNNTEQEYKADNQKKFEYDVHTEPLNQPQSTPAQNTATSLDEIQNNVEKVETEFKPTTPKPKRNSECPVVAKSRERKLSLDHTMLTRREGLSQSEIDLHSIGKSPLERKSSFFRKKMDSFLKNTTEIFKRQSFGSKPQSVSRRGSMSVSLQSLNEKAALDIDDARTTLSQQEVRGSTASIASGSTLGASEHDSVGSQAALSASQPNVAPSQGGPTSANDVQDSLLSSRAISMSSGLDSAFGQRRRKTSRSNRVTWVASEGLTNYLRRLTQDESTREIYAAHSYQDFSSIPENSLHEPKLDSKGRRLSYQRAVSGEDPVLPPRYQDSSLRRKPTIPEHSEANYELSNQLAEFTRNGVPPLEGFNISASNEPYYRYIVWAENRANIDGVCDWGQLSPNEEARQAVIRELIATEADYLRHIICLVELFIASAHALQDSGRMLAVDTAKLFSNIPDVLNASLSFWQKSFFPMLKEADENGTPYNTDHMFAGFEHFRDILSPYEKYVFEQSKVLEYVRTLSNDSDFMTYLQWCHSHRSCNRLQLADLIIKPMQRLTKYGILLRRIITHTDTQPERISLCIMEANAKNYVTDINRSIRQRDELEKMEQLANSIDVYDKEFKDDDMDRYFKMYSHVNLRAPMVNCIPTHSRSLVYEGDLRYKDNTNKEIEVHVFLFTDMMLICKKMSKGSVFPYKLIRPKYMVDRMAYFPRYSAKNPNEIASLIIVMVDDVGSSYHCFCLSEPAKEPCPPGTIKMWEIKVREARLSYDFGVWYARNPSRDLSEVDVDSSSDYGGAGSSTKGSKQNSEDINIEREARERVAAMLHRSMGASTDLDYSQASILTDSFDVDPYGRPPTLHSLRYPMHRNSTSSSRQSRLSSFQQSTSAASHDEPQPGPSRCNYRAGSSVEHVIPPQNPDDAVTSITVNVVSESESETVVPSQQSTSMPHKVQLRSAGTASHNTLRVQPQSGVLALVHSLPDLTIDPSPLARPAPIPTPQSASEKLYQSHQELLQRNRLSATQHHQYLTPDHRGTSYPPPSPTRAALRRGMAFSDSFKYPPLSKMGHVNSQSQQQLAEPQPGPSTAAPRSEQGAAPLTLAPAASPEKDKKKHLISSKNKGGRSETASERRKEDKGE